MAICDFCSSPEVRWAFPTRDFRTQREVTATAITAEAVATQDVSINFGSGGGWAACPACHALIVRGDRERLTRRSAKRLCRKYRQEQNVILSLGDAIRLLRPLHDDFWANRMGPPVPTTPDHEDPTRD